MTDVPSDRASKKSGCCRSQNVNCFSKMFFLWTVPLFWKGYSNELVIEDLGETSHSDLSQSLGDKLEKSWFEEIERSRLKKRPPALWRALVKTFLMGYIIDGVLLFIQNLVCKPLQPVLLSWLVSEFVVSTRTGHAVEYALSLLLVAFVGCVIQHNVGLRQLQRGMWMRVACCSMLYRKILRLSHGSLGETTAGQLVNMMSNDVNRFDQVLMFPHYLWIMPFQIVVMTYLIYSQVKMASIIGVICIILQTLPVQSYLSSLTSKLRLRIATRTDERVRLMSEIITGIQVIKMYAWEQPFEKIVAMARVNELSVVKSASYIRGVYMSFMVFTERASLYITLLAYSLMGNPISASSVFSLAQFYNRLQETLAFHYPNAVSMGAECLVTVRRIQDFLMMEERESLPPPAAHHLVSNMQQENNRKMSGKGIGNLAFESGPLDKIIGNLGCVETNTSLILENVTASWYHDTPTLSQMSLTLPKGEMCAIIGPVGAGKSSFLQLLLKELPLRSGKMNINGKISYASQEPWLFVASVRNNILFEQPFNADRYKQVVKVCALEADFKQFPYGDQTIVDERGVSLSGGQRARINLARAIYKEADIYLLDDPLSAVDTHVGRHLFEQCILTYLRRKTRILVTHQLHYLKDADRIILLKDGLINNVGTYKELAASGTEFTELLASFQEDAKEEESNAAHKTSTLMRQASIRSNSPSVAGREAKVEQSLDLNAHGCQSEEAEESGSGRVAAIDYWRYWAAAGNNWLFALMLIAMVFGQLTATGSDYWVTYWSNQQNRIDNKAMMADYSGDENTPTSTFLTSDSNVTRNNHTQWDLFNSTSNSTHDFSIWDNVGPLNTAEYLYIYTGVIIACVIFITARAFIFFIVCIKSSKGLHDNMFSNLLRTPMRFFDTNASGRILNRFSKDMGIVDEMLPRAWIEVFQIWLVFFSIIGLVGVTNYWLLLPIAVILIVFYFALSFYLNTAQDIKRLESVYRSPVFSHVTAALSGITTIRATHSQTRLIKEFDSRQDTHTIAWYQYLASSSTLGFWLDMVCILFLACVCFSFICAKEGTVYSGDVGLAVSQTLILMGMLQFGVRQIAEVISQMTNVERVLQYTTLPTEEGLEKGEMETPAQWPSSGCITFTNTSLSYSPTEPPVLKDLCFSVQSGWKVGIVGRTGAGKSSLISALFRLTKVDGSLTIDGIETKNIALQDVRSNISIIPQDPVLFSATMRYNLDPLGKYEDAALWSSLEAVELKDSISTLEHRVTEGGSNFSLGQRQLICLARAILTKNRILVLDEATANVDPQTDFFIQKTIREKFFHCTVLTVAHRLNTIMDSNRVLVMDKGRVLEYDEPYLLLQNQESHFYSMVQETGNTMAATLTTAARIAYEDRGGVIQKDDVSIDKNNQDIPESSIKDPNDVSETLIEDNLSDDDLKNSDDLSSDDNFENNT